MIITGSTGESASWYYARTDDTGTSVQRHSPGRVEQTEIETVTAPKTGVQIGIYDPEANALLSAEV